MAADQRSRYPRQFQFRIVPFAMTTHEPVLSMERPTVAITTEGDRMSSVMWIAGAMLCVFLAGCADDGGNEADTDKRATDREGATVLALPCPSSDQRPVDLDIKGPGQPTPEQAVAPFAEGAEPVAREGERETRVFVLESDGTVASVFIVSRHDDGWWPDAYTDCAT
jgi:hypothetical protein